MNTLLCALCLALQTAVNAGDIDGALRYFADAARRGRAVSGTEGELMGLSPRENDVLAMLADGLTDREIANALTISPRTVETHVSNILHKLGVRNRAEAVLRSQRLGLIA